MDQPVYLKEKKPYNLFLKLIKLANQIIDLCIYYKPLFASKNQFIKGAFTKNSILKFIQRALYFSTFILTPTLSLLDIYTDVDL